MLHRAPQRRHTWPGSAISRLFALAPLVAFLACQGDAEAGVATSPEAVTPLAVGQRVPHAQVENARGEAFDLAALVRERGALLVFYRGGW